MEIFDKDEFEAVEQKIEQSEPKPEPQVAPEPELPEKYKGKTAAEIARMHQEAEKLIGRHAQEVAEVRQLADQLIKSQIQTPKQAQPEVKEELDDVDFFADPKTAIAKAVEQHPAVRQAQLAAIQTARQESLRSLKEKHADYKEVIGDSDFQEWVKASRVRQQLFMAADRNYDFDAADELLSTYKEVRQRKQEASKEKVEEVRSMQEESLRAAANPAVGGSMEPASKKIFRRADLIRMQLYQPDRYEELQPEIMQAYLLLLLLILAVPLLSLR